MPRGGRTSSGGRARRCRHANTRRLGLAVDQIGVDSVGIGAVASIQAANPTLSEAGARAAGSTAADALVAAVLVYAAPPGCAPCDTVSWRLVRRSGTVVYLVPGHPGAPSPGALFGENEMLFIERVEYSAEDR